MRLFGFNAWEQWHREGYRCLPVVRVARRTGIPPDWTGLMDGPASVLLESGRAGRYTFACDRPARILVGWKDRGELRSADATETIETRVGPPLDVVQALLRERKAPDLPGWPAMIGGWLGVFGYDLVHTWEQLPFRAGRDVPLPLYALIEPRELFIYDHAERELGVVVWTGLGAGCPPSTAQFGLAEQAADAALVRWQNAGSSRSPRPNPTPPEPSRVVPGPSFTGPEFEAAVRRVQEYIAAGHTYQVNLSLRESRATAQSPGQIYEALRRVNPSPYMGLLRLPDWALVCGSPELLVSLVDGRVSSRPIAGTRPRGEAPPADRRLSAELSANEKERAEHLMLVDLIRNDIGRIARFGSVRVAEFMVLERYSHVMHLVSQVEGLVADGCSWADVFRAMFPGGTITGCPKYRTIEIIEELEPVGRGFYTGALGWISYSGAMEMNIVIRSMLVQGGVAHVQAGAGIVADSVPERELDEARRKAQALWLALATASPLHA